ncbi:MAG: hypothetical protein LC631_07990, partial [Desulfovibrionales bacterium]|nr:hypothetical protein [Desulfovibrionales bacterium]
MTKNPSSTSMTTKKIFPLILCLSFVPVIITITIIYALHAGEVRKISQELAEQNAHFQAQNINDYLNNVRSDLRQIVNVAEFQNLKQAELSQIFSNYIQSFFQIAGIVLIDNFGNIKASAGYVPIETSLSEHLQQIRNMPQSEIYSFLSAYNTDQWKIVMGQKIAAESGPFYVNMYIPLESILPVKSIPGSFPARWSAFLSSDGNLLEKSGNLTIEPEVYREQAAKSSETQRMTHSKISLNDETMQLMIVPVSQNLMLLGLSFDPGDFSINRRPLLNQSLIIILGWAFLLIPLSYIMARRTSEYLAQREVRLQSMNEQVVEAGKMASIGELASGIAHEINNPLAIMVEEAGWMQDLLEEEKDHLGKGQNFEELKRSLNQIRTQGRRCKDITHKILSFSRKSDSKMEDVDLNALAEETTAISNEKAKNAGVKILLDLDKNIQPVQASSTEMQQV